MTPTSLPELTIGLPPKPTTSAAEVAEARKNASDNQFFVVLDDDPTGTQSVSDLPVLTSWTVDDFTWAISTGKPAVYVMTNSRSLSPDDAARVNREVVERASAAARETTTRLAFVSRSDSTLRGHFPLEPTTIADALISSGGQAPDGIVVVPAFPDAARVTIHGTHYAGSKNSGFVPVAESEFAKDSTFGYSHSFLPQWIEEKTAGEVESASVIVLDIEDLRVNLDRVVDQLMGAKDRALITADALTEEDLRQLSLALVRAEEAGKRFIYRVGPPFVRARIGQEEHSPLSAAEIESARSDVDISAGGLVVIGSHVSLTTRQLEHLRASQNPTEFELDVHKAVDEAASADYVSELASDVADALTRGNVVLATSRTLVKGKDGQSSLAISRAVSETLVRVTRQAVETRRPAFVIAKGGITSSDIAAKALDIRRATVVGPMLPGIVSLWVADEGFAKGIPYVVFAGNVGDETSLSEVAAKLSVR